jgi:DNA-binding NarL/FixJ family response regulator
MLVGRDAELTMVARLLDTVSAGGNGALAVVGEPGMGTTALLEAASELGGQMQVLAACGAESEAELPFSGLADLVRPVIEHLDALPAPQAAALAGALALAPPSPGDRFAVCAAAQAIVERAAQERPVLVLVDDLHWFDGPSRECVLYVARRPPTGVAVLVALREEAGDLLPHELRRMSLSGLARADALRLLADRAPDLAAPVAAELATAAEGNPLALVELASTLTGDQRAGRAPLDQPAIPGPCLRHAFARRLDALPAATRTALLVLAAEGTGDLAPVARACDRLGIAADALEVAEAAGLLRLSAGHAEVVQPTVAGIAYHDAPGAERRRAHGALAEALSGDRAAWHLAAAAAGPSEAAAQALDQVAAGAAARRGYATSVAALELAARLSTERGARMQRLIQAAGAGMMAGLTGRARAALALLDDLAPGPDMRVPAAQLRGLLDCWDGDVREGGALLLRTADELAPIDPAGAAGLLADAAMASSAVGDCRETLRRAAAAVELLATAGDVAGDVRARALAAHAWALVLRGQSRRARPLLAELDACLAAVDPLSTEAQFLVFTINLRLPEEGYARARRDALAIVTAARESGALAAIPMPLQIAGHAALRLGDWSAARSEAAEVVELAEATDQRMPLDLGVLLGAMVDASTGAEDSARAALARQLAFTERAGIGSGVTWGTAVLGFLELSLGRIPEALKALERVEQRIAEEGMEEPTLIPWAPDLVEALVRVGRAEDAKRVTHTLTLQAEASGTATATAMAARCRGIVAAGAGEPEFERALTHHARSPVPFELARTRLAYGAKLHRAGHRADAREQLRGALEIFTRLGAEPWAEHARSELRSAGGRFRGRRDGLTAAELRVARAVARGATNRQAAAELFLSPKTVESHLAHAYRKLGVKSRTQLAIALNAADKAARRGSP